MTSNILNEMACTVGVSETALAPVRTIIENIILVRGPRAEGAEGRGPRTGAEGRGPRNPKSAFLSKYRLFTNFYPQPGDKTQSKIPAPGQGVDCGDRN